MGLKDMVATFITMVTTDSEKCPDLLKPQPEKIGRHVDTLRATDMPYVRGWDSFDFLGERSKKILDEKWEAHCKSAMSV